MPIYQHPYRKSQYERQLIQEEVDKMLQAGIIRPSRSPWSSPVLLVRKKDDTWRFCVDFRKLNIITTVDPFPLPRIDDILDRLVDSKWYTTIDLKSGYWQIPMHEQSIPLFQHQMDITNFWFYRLVYVMLQQISVAY